MDLKLDKKEIEFVIEQLKEKVKSLSHQLKTPKHDYPQRESMEKELAFGADVLHKVLFQVTSEPCSDTQEIIN